MPWWWNGRHEGLKILWPEMAVRVRVSSEALFLLFPPCMKKIFYTLLFLCASTVATFADDVLGKWILDDGSAIVEVYKSGDSYNGKIVWLLEPTFPDGTPARDVLNPDKSLRSREIIGLNMLFNLKKQDDKYVDGSIYDPSNGKTYHCTMIVKEDVLSVRGSLDKKGRFGRTMDWFRVKE